jgi:hypothetical protein
MMYISYHRNMELMVDKICIFFDCYQRRCLWDNSYIDLKSSQNILENSTRHKYYYSKIDLLDINRVVIVD